MKVIAIIPVRDYDKNIPDKNLLPFASGTLLSHKIDVLSRVKAIDRIFVYTESKKLAKHVAELENISILWRPIELAHPDTVFNDLIKDAMSKINEATIVWAHATSPLVDEHDFIGGLNAYEVAQSSGFDSLVTVCPVKRHILDANGPLNFRRSTVNRSPLVEPELYSVVGAFSIASSEKIAKWGYNWGRSPFLYQLPQSKSIDICTMDDYEMAQRLLSSAE